MQKRMVRFTTYSRRQKKRSHSVYIERALHVEAHAFKNKRSNDVRTTQRIGVGSGGGQGGHGPPGVLLGGPAPPPKLEPQLGVA